MPQVGFEPMIPVFERAKTVHASDSAPTVVGKLLNILRLKVMFSNMCTETCQTNTILVRMFLILSEYHQWMTSLLKTPT
jgi:hypothetical protein